MKTKLFVAICVPVLLWGLKIPEVKAAASGCIKGIVSCTVMTGVKKCTADLVCHPGYSARGKAPRPQSVLSRWHLTLTGSMYANCYPAMASGNNTVTTFQLSASANTMSPTSRLCQWQWNSSSYVFLNTPQAGNGGKNRSVIQATSGNVSIGPADGLPVELMEFSIEE